VLAHYRRSLHLGIATFGILVVPVAFQGSTAASDPPPEGAPEDVSTPGGMASEACLTNTICSVKERIRWQTPAWTPSQCRKVADAVAASSKKYDLSPTLLLAIMVNESDMNEKAARTYTRDGQVYAKDGGLMAIRCLVDKHDHCTNGDVKGLAWKDLMEPATNIELGARALAHYRDGGAVMEKTIVKLEGGKRVKVTKEVPCTHQNHAFWAHYNHGPRYIDKGYPRHYPHRIAVLDHALAHVMNSPAPELANGHITMHDPGKRERTPDRPLEPRYKKLCDQILSSTACSAVALN
jgi:Transglycosylase SLT domain